MPTATTKTLALATTASLLTSVLWLALAWRSPSSTFHFAPLIVAGVGPYTAKAIAGRQQVTTALLISAVSLAVVIGAIAVMTIGDRMQGPSFWSEDGAPLEAVLFAAAGAAIGIAMLARRPVAVAG
jgi:hypothetical protein